MKFRYAPLLIYILASISVDAVPVSDPPSRTITTHLNRIQHPRDVHPLIRRQQMVNRAVLRMAHINGRSPPSDSNQSSSSNVIGGPDSANNFTVGQNPTFKNTLPLENVYQDAIFAFTISIGSNQKKFLMQADCGSADLWVPSEHCIFNNGRICGNQTLGETSSSTFRNLGQPWDIIYVSGSVNGTKVTDNVTIGDLQLNQYLFGVADSVTDYFSNDSSPVDGLVGFGKPGLSKMREQTLIEAMVNSNLMDEQIMSYKLSRHSETNDGELTFGGRNPSKFDPNYQVNLSCIDNDPRLNVYWATRMDAVTVNGKDTIYTDRPVIFDTGTSFILAPPDDVANVHMQINGSQLIREGHYSISCNMNATVALTFGNMSFDINSKDLVGIPVDFTGENCHSEIVGGVETAFGNNVWLVGIPFLKNVYLTTDMARNQIALAKLLDS